MSDLAVQASFNSGEWSPKLFARVDMQKYRSGAALLSNFFVDYRGGASTRPGTKYILQCYKSATAVRLIPFQASFDVGYVLEFGDKYIRFYFDGAPVLETATSITGASSVPINTTFIDNAHGYSNGDWIFAAGNYYIVSNVTTNSFTLTDLQGNLITANPFTFPVAASRVYTLVSPYAAADLALIKFAQSVNQMILCHPNYAPQVLTLVTAANWTIAAIVFGATVNPPSAGLTVTTSVGSGIVNYAYIATSIDANGQESGPSAPATLASKLDISSTPGSNFISWSAVPGAVSYNVYKAVVAYGTAVAAGAIYGYIGNTTGTTLTDTNIVADFSTTPPINENPFFGSGVQSITITSPGTYSPPPTSVPVPTATLTGGGGTGATAAVTMVTVTITPAVAGSGYAVGDFLFNNNIILQVASTDGFGGVTDVTVIQQGTSATTITGNINVQITSGHGINATFNVVWALQTVGVLQPGSGYSTAPAVAFSAGTGTATSTLGAPSAGNPSVPGFFQQRLVLASPPGAPQTFYMSQPGFYFNFDVSQIAQATDAITGTLVSGQLNTIKAMVSQPTGLLMFTSRASWLINGGSNGSAVAPDAVVANAQSFNGISDVPPIIANFDVLYVQSKGSIIRDSAYNIYANVYTGTDISIIPSHLFYGFTVDEWAWAEEPFKVVWAIRNDGVLLTLTFLKEQEFVGWCHSSTTNGFFRSVATVTENTSTAGEVDAIYTVVQRVIEGQSLQYVERIAERTFPAGVVDAWTVDAGIQYVGTPQTSFSGAEHLAGQTVTGLADGVVIPPFTMAADGTFTLGTAASKVTVGLGFTAQLQTLPIELGEPTVQGKVKKIPYVDVRVADTLGLSIGSDFNHLVPMKDLIRGNVGSMLTGQSVQVVTDLFDGDARTILDPTYTVPGQYCIQQSLPYPATILGVFPNIVQGEQHSGRDG